MGLGRGLAGLFKKWGKGIGNTADHVWLREDAQKAIRDEVTKKFQPKIDLANKAESRRAANIKDLGDKVTKSKEDLANAKQAWKEKYDNALADAKNQRQTEIDAYNAKSQEYEDALNKASAGRQSIFDKLYDSEANYNPSKTIFTDVHTGDRYLFNSATGQYTNLTKIYPTLNPQQKRRVNTAIQDYDNRLIDSKSNKVINAFDENDRYTYQGKNNNIFDSYYNNKISTHNADIRDAEKQIQQAYSDKTNWTANNSQPQAWDDSVEKQFKADFNKNNAKPTYSFNGQNYKSQPELEKAYQEALAREKRIQSIDSRGASRYASERDAEIAQRIQDAKDMNKAKAFLGAGALGALGYAAGKAMYGGDDTDNTNNTDNINNIDNTDYGEPDPKLKAENTPEGKAAIIGKSLIDTDFDPDKADAVATLAAASHDAGVEDSNSIESSDDHFIDDDELYGLLKAMEDPHKADAVANYIYSKHGNESDVQRLGWRGWLNKYYGDLLRSRMNLDPSSYKGMHISGGL